MPCVNVDAGIREPLYAANGSVGWHSTEHAYSTYIM